MISNNKLLSTLRSMSHSIKAYDKYNQDAAPIVGFVEGEIGYFSATQKNLKFTHFQRTSKKMAEDLRGMIRMIPEDKQCVEGIMKWVEEDNTMVFTDMTSDGFPYVLMGTRVEENIFNLTLIVFFANVKRVSNFLI